MILFLGIVILILSILIVLSILLQEDKSGGGMSLLGGSSQSFFGVSSGSILSKFTTIILTIFLVLCIFLAIIASKQAERITKGDITRTEHSEYSKKNEGKPNTLVDLNKDVQGKQNADATRDVTNDQP